MNTPLNRSTVPDLPPVPAPRLVHIGLGAFHRAHQLYYTQHAEADPRAPRWSYASFSGRSAELATTLAEQDGLYTLVERGPDADSPELITALAEAHPGDNVARLWHLLAAPTTAVLTLTITEAAYHLNADLEFDAAAGPVAEDLTRLRAAYADGAFDLSAVGIPATTAGKVLVGLAERRRHGHGGLAVVPCDNLSDNDVAARHAIVGLARELDPQLAAWLESEISFVATSIDRITPRPEEGLRAEVAAATGYADRAPVVTEPFASWVLSGQFPAGRPEWERAGAQFVTDLEPFERRKLWLLNGAHSLLAYAGQLRGHTTVADAIADPECRGWVEEFWDEAAAHLDRPELHVPDYRAALLERFGNPRIAHHLAQIAIDGSAKLRVRAVPVLRAEQRAGRDGAGAARIIAAWIAHLAGRDEIQDAAADAVLSANRGTGTERVRALVGLLDAELAEQPETIALIEEQARRFNG